jgi:hypothetical protein
MGKLPDWIGNFPFPPDKKKPIVITRSQTKQFIYPSMFAKVIWLYFFLIQKTPWKQDRKRSSLFPRVSSINISTIPTRSSKPSRRSHRGCDTAEHPLPNHFFEEPQVFRAE